MKALLLVVALMAVRSDAPPRANAQIPAAPTADGSTAFRLGEESNERVEFKWKWSAGREVLGGTLIECARTCNGEKHFLHEQCDDSCDSRCEGRHTETLRPIVDPGDEFRNSSRVQDAITQFGVQLRVEEGKTIGDARNTLVTSLLYNGTEVAFPTDPNSQAKHSKRYRVPCWNDTPCSFSIKSPYYWEYDLDVEIQLYRENDADGKLLRTNGPSVTIRHKVRIPTGRVSPVRETRVSCACSIVQEDKRVGLLPPSGDKWIDGQELAQVFEPVGARYVTGEDLTKYKCEIELKNMNEGTVTLLNPPASMGRMFIPAGWIMRSVDGASQNMLVCTPLNFRFSSDDPQPGPSLQARPITLPVRVLCLDIDKKEPDPSMKFQFAPPQSAKISALARTVRDSLSRGPWDQTQLWIIRDFASQEKCAERLIPGPGARMYVRELRRADQIGALNFDDERVQELFELRFLLAEGLDAADAAWFLAKRLRFDEQGTLAWLGNQRDGFRVLYQQGEAAEDNLFAATVARTLATESGSKGLEMALKILDDYVPSSERTSAAGLRTLTPLGRFLTMPGSTADAKALLDWLEKTKPGWAQYAALNVREDLPADLKARAQKLIVKE